MYDKGIQWRIRPRTYNAWIFIQIMTCQICSWSMKSAKSRIVRSEFKEIINKYYWKDKFWSDSYCKRVLWWRFIRNCQAVHTKIPLKTKEIRKILTVPSLIFASKNFNWERQDFSRLISPPYRRRGITAFLLKDLRCKGEGPYCFKASR
jgi:Transposase IS200 like